MYNKGKAVNQNMGPRPIILAKAPPRNNNREHKERESASGRSSATSDAPIQPTFILKSREGELRAISPGTVVQRKEPEQTYQLLSPKPAPPDPKPARVRMKSCVKLLDDSMQLQDGICEYLMDQSDFIVVGCIGMQGVGKSTIMSNIAGSPVFKVQSEAIQEQALHCTVGIDAFVTPHRMIVLDTQPVLSPSILDQAIQQQQDKKHGTLLEWAPTESGIEIQSLQVAAFIMSVCHIVIAVQDAGPDPTFFRFLHSSEMLKPATAASFQDEEVIEYFPHVVFVNNRCATPDFNPARYTELKDMLGHCFAKSRLILRSGLNGDEINLVLVPEDEEKSDKFRGHDTMKSILDNLRHSLFGIMLNPLTYTPLNEKNWFHYASKTWDGIKKSTFFHEYNRLLP